MAVVSVLVVLLSPCYSEGWSTAPLNGSKYSPRLESKKPVPGRYIISLKEEASLAAHVNSTNTKIASTLSSMTHEFDLINCYAGEFFEDDLNDLRANPDIDSIEEDGIFQTCSVITQVDATWGLCRISSTERLAGDEHALDFKYKYESAAGRGTTVYIIDTGIYIQHPAFEERAWWGKTFGGYNNADRNGHWTHCAGIAVSGPYGIAKSAEVVAVKVLGDDGSGRTSDIIDGMLWVVKDSRMTGKPSVASMNLNGSFSRTMNKTVKALYDSGITVVAAAGNDNDDAGWTSPANAEQAITVAASTIGDMRADFSNFGPPVNIFAPGLNAVSTWNEYGKTRTVSGTSAATSHVAGFVAYLLSLDGTLTPAQIARIIDEKSLKDVLGGVPGGTANRLLNNRL